MTAEHKPMVNRCWGAGRWFPGDPEALEALVSGFMEQADVPEVAGRVVAAISPHAGYVYSGGVAGYTFEAIRRNARTAGAPEVAIVLGFSHRGHFEGVALMEGDAIETPLGTAALDRESGAALAAASPRISMDNRPHGGEHSAENQIPFLQAALPDVPLVVGLIGNPAGATLNDLLRAVRELASRKRVLVVASTDLLHDADYERVTQTDKQTLGLITALRDDALAESWTYGHQVCCGIAPVLTAMRFAKAEGCTAGTLLRYRNSGDDHPESRGNWVVGYGAVVFASD